VLFNTRLAFAIAFCGVAIFVALTGLRYARLRPETANQAVAADVPAPEAGPTRGIEFPPDHPALFESPPTCLRNGVVIDCYTRSAPLYPAKYDEFIHSLMNAQYVYNRINEMWRDTPTDVVLKLAPEGSRQPEISNSLSGEPRAGLIQVSWDVSAELKGSAGIEVSPSDLQKKKFSLSAPTAWQWTVTPTRTGGNNLLTLTIYAHFDDGVPYTLAVYEDRIKVRVSRMQQAQDVLADVKPVWAFMAAAVPSVWAGYVWFRNFRKGGTKRQSERDPENVQNSRKRQVWHRLRRGK
jgi:hypothetical protein